MTSRTSLIISGSSAEVGSSKSITLGSMASARAIATRCCWPPESWAGYFVGLVADADPVEQLLGALASASALRRPRTLIGPSVTFSRIVLWAKRLKLWKTMPTSARRCAERLALGGQRLAVEGDRALVDGLEPVDRAAQRATCRSRTGRSRRRPRRA